MEEVEGYFEHFELFVSVMRRGEERRGEGERERRLFLFPGKPTAGFKIGCLGLLLYCSPCVREFKCVGP